MEKRSTSHYVFIGTAVRYLLDSSVGQRIHEPGGILENISLLSTQLEDAEFHVSHRLMAGLLQQQRAWATEAEGHEDDDAWASTRALTSDEQAKVMRDAGILRETILAEAEGQVAFIAADGRYAVSKLLNNVGELMGAGVYDRLPELAQYDFQQAGRAIAFDLPTAAAFHLLRGTEAVLRSFYQRTVKRDRIPEPRMWAAMVADMRRRKNSPPDVLLTNLDSLRAHFRNPTQHPEKVYDIDEAQDLMSLSFDAIARMVRFEK